MTYPISAIFENGVLKPDRPLELPEGARVEFIILEPQREPTVEERQKAWEDFDKFCEENLVDSGGVRLTREQLYDRR